MSDLASPREEKEFELSCFLAWGLRALSLEKCDISCTLSFEKWFIPVTHLTAV